MRRSGRLNLVGLLSCAVVAAGGLAGCGRDAADTRSGPAMVAFVVPNNKLNFATEMADGFSAGADAVPGVEHTVVGPDIVDGIREVALFHDLTKTHRDGISVFTLAPDLFVEPLAKAGAEGIPLICVDNPPLTGSNVELFVGNDNYQLGEMLADQAIAKLPADARGTVVIGTTSPGVPVLELRAEGIRHRLTEVLPGLSVRGPFDTKQEVAANHAAWELLVEANPDALAFLGTGDADGWNLAEIRRTMGGTWIAGAFDLDPKSLQAVKEGHLVLISPEHFVKGVVAGRLQAEHAATGKPLPQGWIYTPGLAVTMVNIDEIRARQESAEAKTKWFDAEVNKILNGGPEYLRPLSDLR